MTEQEKKQQRGELLAELEDAQLELAHLQERGNRIADKMEAVLKKLRKNTTLAPSRDDFNMRGDELNRLDIGEVCPDSAQIGKLIDEMKAARQKVFNLAERKQQLAHPSGTITI